MKNLLHKASDWIKDKDTISKPVTEKLHFDSNKSTKTLFGGCTTIFMLLFLLNLNMVLILNTLDIFKSIYQVNHYLTKYLLLLGFNYYKILYL